MVGGRQWDSRVALSTLKNTQGTRKAFLTQFTSWASATMWLFKKLSILK